MPVKSRTGIPSRTGNPRRSRRLLFAGLAVLLIAGGLWLKGRPGFAHDTPRRLPWAVPDYRQAQFAHETLPDGRVRLAITHLPLAGVTPEMLAWWYQILPIATVEIEGSVYPMYHIFHLTEHGRLWLKEPASDGRPGMGVGALVARQEWFGQFDSEGAGRIAEFSAQGIVFKPEAAGVQLGELRHRFEATPTGSHYRVDSLIGVQWPLVGPAVNWLLRTTTFTEPMLREWERHQIEEVGMLQHYLPRLYAQRPADFRFRLALP